MAHATLDAANQNQRQLVAYSKNNSGTLVASRPHSFWSIAGNPGAGAFNNTAAGATFSSADAGSLNKANPGTGASQLFKWTGMAGAQSGTLLLCDRLLQAGGTAINITLTSAQTLNTVTLPSRCPTSGTDDTPSTNGYGIYAGVEVSSVTSTGTPTITIAYTNSAGTTTRSATNTDNTVAASIAGSFYRLGLQAGDVGIRSVQTITLSATWTSGNIALVLYRPIASVTCSLANVESYIDWASGAGQRLYDSSCLFFIFIPNTTTTTNVSGTFIETHGG